MDIIDKSQPEFRQRIGKHLEQCASHPHSISLQVYYPSATKAKLFRKEVQEVIEGSRALTKELA